MSSKQEQTLITLYKRMSSTEIRSRLAGTGLIPLARGVAENELQQRLVRGDTTGAARAGRSDPADTQPANKPSAANVAFRLFVVGVFLITLLAGSVLLFPNLAWIIWAVTIFVVAMLIGKAFPLFGKVVGVLLMLSPLAIFGLIIRDHNLKHWGNGEALLMYLCGFIYSCITAAIGSVILKAANHKGSWETLAAHMSEEPRKAQEAERVL